MSLQDRLRQLVQALPSESASVTLSRADLVELLGGEGGEVQATSTRDLTVEDVAEEMGRAPSTVRGWLIAGTLRGYKLNGRDWRVPWDALRAYRKAQQGPDATTVELDDGDVDLGAWRRVG